MPTYVYQQTWDVNLGSPDGSANATRVTSPTHDGAGALRLLCAADVAYWLKNAVAGTQIVVMHAWFRFAVLPDVLTPDLLGIFTAGPNFMGIGYNKVDNKFYCEIGSQGAPASGGPGLVTNQWYALDVIIDAHLATATVNAKVDGVSLPQNTVGGGPYTLADYRVGEYGQSQTYDLYVDTLDVSHTAADFPAVTTPSAPQTLTAVGGDSQVSLSWSAPASNGGSAVTAYKIYRSTVSGSETLLASPAGTGTTYTDGTAANGTTYYYKVTAVNAAGEGILSNEASATPAAPLVPALTRKRLYGPGLLGNAASTLYTCPASTQAVIRLIHVSNPSGAPVNFTLSIGASSAGTRLYDAEPIDAGDVFEHRIEHNLAAGEIIQSFASAAGTLNLTVDGYELYPSVVFNPVYPADDLFPSN